MSISVNPFQRRQTALSRTGVRVLLSVSQSVRTSIQTTIKNLRKILYPGSGFDSPSLLFSIQQQQVQSLSSKNTVAGLIPLPVQYPAAAGTVPIFEKYCSGFDSPPQQVRVLPTGKTHITPPTCKSHVAFRTFMKLPVYLVLSSSCMQSAESSF